MLDTFIALGTAAVCLIGTQLIKRQLSDVSNGSKEFILKHRLLLHPNSISFIGLLLALFSMALYWVGYHGIAINLYIVASFVDNIDGNVARSSGLVTETGKELDPLFDKIKSLPPLVYFLCHGYFPMGLVLAYVCLEITGQSLRPFIRLLNRIFDLELSVAANYFGKIKTVCIHVLIVFCALGISNVIASGFLTAITFLAVCSITFKFIKIESLKNFVVNRMRFSRCKLF